MQPVANTAIVVCHVPLRNEWRFRTLRALQIRQRSSRSSRSNSASCHVLTWCAASLMALHICIILISSGLTITWSHHAIISINFKDRWERLLITILLLGGYFIIIQFQEYQGSSLQTQSMGQHFLLSLESMCWHFSWWNIIARDTTWLLHRAD